MTRYAVVVSASDSFIPGVNALLNSLKYYDNDVEFHLLSKADDLKPYVQSAQENGFYPKLVTIDLWDYLDRKGCSLAQRHIAYIYKAYRYMYCVDRLRDYDAVLILDADMVILNNIMWAFDVAACTERIVIAHYSILHPELPYTSVPVFFKPSKYIDVFGSVPSIWDKALSGDEIILPFCGRDRGDMPALNYVLANRSDVHPIVLPNLLWGANSWSLHNRESEVWIAECYLDNHRYLMAYNEDKLNILHARWWIKDHIDNHLRKPNSTFDLIRNRSLRLFWETYYFFNNKCYHNIEWNTEGWGYPDMFNQFPGFF